MSVFYLGFGSNIGHLALKNQKMAEISSLQQSLSEKISLAMQIRLQLSQKMAELEKEIKVETELLAITKDTIVDSVKNLGFKEVELFGSHFSWVANA